MATSDASAPVEFVDAGPPLTPAAASTLEFELEARGIATRLRICERGPDGDRQVLQVRPADLEAALAMRDRLFPRAAPEAPPLPRSHRLRNGLVAAVLGLVASLRVARLVVVPKGPTTALVVLGVAGALFAAAFGLTKDPPASGP